MKLFTLVSALVLLCGCAAGSPDTSVDDADAGTADAMGASDAAVIQGETVCSPEGMACTSNTVCCQQPFGMICAAHEGYDPVCRIICVTDYDCQVMSGSTDTCQHVINQSYGACEPSQTN